jgi:hypothetical protein
MKEYPRRDPEDQHRRKIEFSSTQPREIFVYNDSEW